MLLLFDDGAVAAVASQLLETLGSGFRLLLPALAGHGSNSADAGRDSFCAWLRNFMDGLGIDRFAAITTTAYAATIAAFSASDPDRIQVMVVLDTGSPAVAVHPAFQWNFSLTESGLLSASDLARVLDHLRSISAPPDGVLAETD